MPASIMAAMKDTPHGQVLDALAARGRLRALSPRRGADFASNDYLALAGSALLRDAAAAALARGVAVGAGASRLLRGNHPEHEALEEEAAAFFGSETALYFPTGFAAGAALSATLPRREDLILYDALMHASFRDGLDPARVAAVATPHNDANAVGMRSSGGGAAGARAGCGSRRKPSTAWMATAPPWPILPVWRLAMTRC
jgi:8-amino-7-oxononanoate synthase